MKHRARGAQHRRLSLEERYRRGDKRVIMQELHLCLAEEKPLPKWLKTALLHAIMGAVLYDFDSWDDVFGPPCVTGTGRPAKGKTRSAAFKKEMLSFRIYKRVEQLKTGGSAVDRKLFEKVADELGIGRALLEQIYYDSRVEVAAAEEAVKTGLQDGSIKIVQKTLP